MIYLLLRQVDDATDFREVYPPVAEDKDELRPFVGVAASDQPVIERPPEGDFAGGVGRGVRDRDDTGAVRRRDGAMGGHLDRSRRRTGAAR